MANDPTHTLSAKPLNARCSRAAIEALSTPNGIAAGEGLTRHIAAIIEEWDMKDPPDPTCGHAYEDIARDIIARAIHSRDGIMADLTSDDGRLPQAREGGALPPAEDRATAAGAVEPVPVSSGAGIPSAFEGAWAVREIASQVQYWLDGDARHREREGLPIEADNHIMPPTWPNRSQLGNWIIALTAAAQAIEARRAETQGGSVHESAVPQGCAHPSPLKDIRNTDR